LDALFPHRGGAPRLGGGAAFLDRDARVRRRRPVHAEEVQQVSPVVDGRDADVPVVLLRLGLGGGSNPLAILERQHGARFHTRNCTTVSPRSGTLVRTERCARSGTTVARTEAAMRTSI